MFTIRKPRRLKKEQLRRAQVDYIDKLGADDRAWLERFNAEYHAAEGLDDAEALHGPQHHDDLHGQLDALRRDVTTATPEAVAAHQTRSRYSAADYCEGESTDGPEAALIEALTRRPRRAGRKGARKFRQTAPVKGDPAALPPEDAHNGPGSGSSHPAQGPAHPSTRDGEPK